MIATRGMGISVDRSPTQPIREIAQVALGGVSQSGVMALKIAQFAAPLAPPTRKFRKAVIHTSTVLDCVVETPQLVHGSGAANSLLRNPQSRKLFLKFLMPECPRSSALARSDTNSSFPVEFDASPQANDHEFGEERGKVVELF